MPVTVDIPHQLGRAGARARIESKIGRLAEKIPGGGAVEHHWEGDSLHLVVTAMGQTVTGRIDVAEAHVRVEVALPGMLGLFAGMLRSRLEQDGPRLLAQAPDR